MPGGWVMNIAEVDITVDLPGDTDDVLCLTGTATPGPPCEISPPATAASPVQTGALAPNTPVTVRAPLEMDPPGLKTLPWPIALDAVLGQSLPLAVILLLLAVVGLGVGLWWTRTSHETDPGFPVMYTPPEGLGPVQSYFMTRERVPGTGLVATLLYMGERGLVRLTENGPGAGPSRARRTRPSGPRSTW